MKVKGKNNRIGEQVISKFGKLMTIIEYNNYSYIVVEFEDGYRVKSNYSNFKKGNIKSVYDKSVLGVGYIGEGKDTVSNGIICGQHTIQYDYWKSILTRCYSENYHKKEPSYNNCSVCEEWHNFQNFAKWFDQNYYEVEGQTMQLDKDILLKGNKVYSPETCIFVPQRINSLFIKHKARRGKYPMGVYFNKSYKKFNAQCSIFNKVLNKFCSVNLKYYNTPEEAFYKYKEFKEDYIKEVAEEYKDKIPKKLYEAMYRYEVDIND